MAYLFRRTSTALQSAGFQAVAHVPFILYCDMSYADEVNRFLRERALADWHPNNRHGEPASRVRVPSENTIFAISRDLENFLTYVEIAGLNWRVLTYKELLAGYQADQSNGAWSERGAPLAPSTINRRVGSVCEFLTWACDRGLRGSFEVLEGRSTSGRHSRKALTRMGRVREPVERLRIPTVAEISIWLAEISAKRGKARELACRTVLETGMRLEEVALLQAEQVPDPTSIPGGYPARMDICYGTKGGRQVGDPSKRGKMRTLRFGMDFLYSLDDYRRLRRAKALALFRRSNPRGRLPKELFLDEATGYPLTSKMVYDSWVRCCHLPFPGWSPHAGRHAFACLLLLRLIHEECERIGKTVSTFPRTALIGSASDLVQLYIRPILGHVSEQTTARYLEWVADHFLIAEHRGAWSRYLDDCHD